MTEESSVDGLFDPHTYPPIMSEGQWVEAAAKMIRDEGEEQFLVNMLYMLRKSLPE